jgi:hypothetical protein
MQHLVYDEVLFMEEAFAARSLQYSDLRAGAVDFER